MARDRWCFGRFELRRETRELLAEGRPQKLGERAFDILLALIEADGRPVGRETLFERAWPGRAVLDDNLKVQVMALRRLLGAEALVTVPGQGYRLALTIRSDDAPADAAPLFGREADLALLRAAWAPGRLVSLVGPGGVGKTRLALAAAQDASAAAFAPDGTLFVELAPLADPGALAGTLARALALPPGAGESALLAALKPLALRLVLDNAEHLREAVAALAARLLANAPRLALLVTSQEPLGLDGEQVLRIDGLALAPAAALLGARAAALGFAPGPDDAAVIDRLCARLDGLPLAIELAAARVPLLGFAGVDGRLNEALALLTRGASTAPARQQTLRAALQWSHGLLDPMQQAVFRRLAVFAGGFALEAAQAVVADDGLDAWAVLDALESLVAKSLVQMQVQGDARRFRLPEAARAFALERLAEAAESDALRQRHAQSMTALFEAADSRYPGAPALPWLDTLLPELDNLRAAVAWTLEHDEPLAIRLCAASGAFWAMTGLFAESGPPLRRLAPKVDEHVPPAVRALFWLTVANRSADAAFGLQETWEAAERAIAIARDAGLAMLQYRALGRRLPLALRVGANADAAATAAEMRGLEGADWTPSQRRLRRAAEGFGLYERGEWGAMAELEARELALLRAAGDDYRAWIAAHRLALALTALDRAAEAVPAMDAAAEQIRAHGLERQCWQQMAAAVMVHIEAGSAEPAAVHEVLRLLRGAGAPGWLAAHIAWWLAQRGQSAAAARLLGWIEARAAPQDPVSRRAVERAAALLAATASSERQQDWRQEGAAWDDEAMVEAVLGAG
jgi:predicted ATPase/DNA-binding winged helix-turn-helix (wHTH) protein